MKKNSFCFLAVLTLVIYSVLLYFCYTKIEQNATQQAIKVANDFLRNNQATKIFFNEDQKQNFKHAQKQNFLDENAFLPELYSCTYASVQINKYYNEIRKKENLSPITIQFVASNPKNPNNKADEREQAILKSFQQNQASSYYEVLENSNGTKSLYYAKPNPKVQESCLECHGKPSDAPKALIREYGLDNGFYHAKGDIRAFIKILMPLDEQLAVENELFWKRTLAFSLSLFSLFVFLALFMQKSQRETKKFQSILDSLDEMVILKSSKKVLSVNKSFLDFFGVSDIKEFELRYKCLSSHFKDNEHDITLDLQNINAESITKFQLLEPEQKVVKMNNAQNELKTLCIKIEKLIQSKNEYIIILSDITQLEKRAEMLEKKANTDSLTKIYTRQKFEELYSLELHRSQRYINSLSILFLDIDHFKNINDLHGHDIGDETLKTFTRLIGEEIREYDVFARWGGEEFILMLPQTDINAAYKIAEKLRKKIGSHPFENLKGLTCSIGVSMLQKDDDFHSLIKRADNALYKAKNTGRNKTIIDF